MIIFSKNYPYESHIIIDIFFMMPFLKFFCISKKMDVFLDAAAIVTGEEVIVSAEALPQAPTTAGK